MWHIHCTSSDTEVFHEWTSTLSSLPRFVGEDKMQRSTLASHKVSAPTGTKAPISGTVSSLKLLFDV